MPRRSARADTCSESIRSRKRMERQMRGRTRRTERICRGFFTVSGTNWETKQLILLVKIHSAYSLKIEIVHSYTHTFFSVFENWLGNQCDYSSNIRILYLKDYTVQRTEPIHKKWVIYQFYSSASFAAAQTIRQFSWKLKVFPLPQLKNIHYLVHLQ